MKIAAVVPFKCFTRAKRRLRARYSDPEVEEIGRAMLSDVLQALQEAHSLERAVVLTDDPAVAELTEQAGSEVHLRQPDPGLNPAIERATQELEAAGCEAVVVVLGDVPLLRGCDLDRVIEAGRKHPVVIVPSSDGGTAILFRRPPSCLPARFGPDSAAAHEAEARRRGIEPLRLSLANGTAALDLDTPEDADRLLESEVPCRTRDVLRKYTA